MKLTKFKPLLVTIPLLLFWLQGFSQLVGSRIDVKGQSNCFSDKMWLFTVSTCTRYFDNGWDGFKMIGTSQAPQIYAVEPDGNYQIDVVSDVNNTSISFIAGMDTTYTMTFTHQYLSNKYSQLYLIDSIANKIIDIYTSGTNYTFSASNKIPVNRFKIVTGLNNQSTINSTATSVNEIKDQAKNIKIYSFQKNIYISNTGDQPGKVKVYNATTGNVITTASINSNGISTISTDVPAGTYIINCVTQNEDITTKVLVW